MGRNFDDYPGFQPKKTPAQRYANSVIRHKTHVCGINVPLYPESDWDQKSSQKSIRHDVCSTQQRLLSYLIT